MTRTLYSVRALVACLAIVAFAAISTHTATGSATAGATSGYSPASPQPTNLKPGLSVRYFFHFVRGMKAFSYYTGKGKGKGENGTPLNQINFRSGFGNVLTSSQPDGVLAVIDGYIKFDKPGSYAFRVHSNDGVRFFLSEKLMFEDPDWHAEGDSMSDPFKINIEKAGWYPLTIWYFERKGTSTLELFWQPPGAAKMAHVPPSAFGHKAGN